MSALTPIEAYDWLRTLQTLGKKLEAAEDELSKRRGVKRERGWLTDARDLISTELAAHASVLTQARGLAELAEIAAEDAGDFQERWVDALEKLLAGITFHAGSRSPLIEALYPHVKLPALRRAKQDVAFDFARELERRLKSGYVTRMLADADFAFALPVIESITQAEAAWKNALSPTRMPEESAATLREQLVAAGERAEIVARQAKLLAEAAFAPFEGSFDELGLNVKPRRRPSKPVEAVAPPPPPPPEPPEEPASAKPKGKKARNNESGASN